MVKVSKKIHKFFFFANQTRPEKETDHSVRSNSLSSRSAWTRARANRAPHADKPLTSRAGELFW